MKKAHPGELRRVDTTQYKDMPDPTPEQVEHDPLFQAIWHVIKTWDVNAPEYYAGYCGANGSHVALILNAIQDKI